MPSAAVGVIAPAVTYCAAGVLVATVLDMRAEAEARRALGRPMRRSARRLLAGLAAVGWPVVVLVAVAGWATSRYPR